MQTEMEMKFQAASSRMHLEDSKKRMDDLRNDCIKNIIEFVPDQDNRMSLIRHVNLLCASFRGLGITHSNVELAMDKLYKWFFENNIEWPEGKPYTMEDWQGEHEECEFCKTQHPKKRMGIRLCSDGVERKMCCDCQDEEDMRDCHECGRLVDMEHDDGILADEDHTYCKQCVADNDLAVCDGCNMVKDSLDEDDLCFDCVEAAEENRRNNSDYQRDCGDVFDRPNWGF